MKLLRYGEIGQEKPACLDQEGQMRDLSAHIGDLNETVISPQSLDKLAKIDVNNLPLVVNNPRIAPVLTPTGKMICVGLNYYDHAEEMELPLPSHPMIFMKANSAIAGANDDVIMPKGAKQTDWEVELAMVIGRKAKYVKEEEALDYVAGYTIMNDISERHLQKDLGGQWTKGKSCDGFGPLGPFLVTKDEIPDPHNLGLWLDVNGVRMQSGHTSKMIFKLAYIVSHLSEIFTLYPGDIISTGTPAGVGMGKKPEAIYLKDGDLVELGIDGLGQQTQRFKAG